MKYTPELATALITSGGDEFLTMRRPGDDQLLELPTTTLEPPESPSEAVARQLKEDFDLKVESSLQMTCVDARLPHGLAAVYIMQAVVDEDDLRYVKNYKDYDMRCLNLTQLRYGQRTGQYTLSPLLSRVMTLMNNGQIELQDEEPVAAEG